MKIIFFGSSKFVIPLIKMLHNNFNLALVVTTETDPNDTVPAYCTVHNIPFKSVKAFDKAVITDLHKIDATVGVLAYFGVLLPKALLNIFPKGILNIHPSLLPKYRGPTPVQSAILNGDEITGVTIIRLDEQMDHGPILDQVKEPISPTDTTASLHDKLFTKGTEMLKEIIPGYIDGKIKLQEQDEMQATFTKKDFTRQDGYFEAASPPPKDELDRMIRAYFPWPTAWTQLKINDKEKIVKFLPSTIGHPEHVSGSNIASQIPDQVRNDKEILIQVEGGKPMSIKDFLNGYPELQDDLQKII